MCTERTIVSDLDDSHWHVQQERFDPDIARHDDRTISKSTTSKIFDWARLEVSSFFTSCKCSRTGTVTQRRDRSEDIVDELRYVDAEVEKNIRLADSSFLDMNMSHLVIVLTSKRDKEFVQLIFRLGLWKHRRFLISQINLVCWRRLSFIWSDDIVSTRAREIKISASILRRLAPRGNYLQFIARARMTTEANCRFLLWFENLLF